MAIIRADDELAAVKARLRALQAMTTDRGCTEAEAMAAATAAAKLMQQHALSPDEAQRPPFAEAVIWMPTTAAKQPWASLWRTIADGCGCEVWSQAGGLQPSCLIYFGFDPDVLVADYLHAMMVRHVETGRRAFIGSAEYRRRRIRRTKAKAVSEFLHGFIARLRVSLREYFALNPRADQAERRQAVDRAVERKQLEFSKARRSPKVERTESFWRGAAAGGRVDIHGGVAGGAANPAVSATLRLGGPRS